MNTDIRKTLLNLITEYGHCLTRIEAERDMMKSIEARAEHDCQIAKTPFRAVAAAHHKDEVAGKQKELHEQIDLFILIQGERFDETVRMD